MSALARNCRIRYDRFWLARRALARKWGNGRHPGRHVGLGLIDNVRSLTPLSPSVFQGMHFIYVGNISRAYPGCLDFLAATSLVSADASARPLTGVRVISTDQCLGPAKALAFTASLVVAIEAPRGMLWLIATATPGLSSHLFFVFPSSCSRDRFFTRHSTVWPSASRGCAET